MASRRFCDLCDEGLTPEDDKPFVRLYSSPETSNNAIGHIMIVNEQNHVLTDVCNGCKLKVVNEGKPHDPTNMPQIATLQQPHLVRATPVESTPPPLPFVPSIPPAPASRGEEL